MAADKLAPVLPVDDVAAAVTFWREVLGVDATFVDGDRWAQFDVGGSRLALAGADRTSDLPGVMVKVDDVAATRERLVGAGHDVTPVERGPHELRCVLDAPGGVPVTLYSPGGPTTGS